MRHRIDPPDELLRLAALQDGVVTHEQVTSFGLGRNSIARLIGSHRWHRLSTGLYLVGGGEPSWNALAWGGVLLGGDTARLGGLAAGYLHRLVDEPPEQIVILLDLGHQRTDRGCWLFQRERPGVRSALLSALPLGSASRTPSSTCAHRASIPISGRSPTG